MGIRIRPIELNFKQGEKVRVSPVGNFSGLDGRNYVLDGKAIIASIQKNGLHIPLDENHRYGRAMGWFDFNSFETREDGIYASLELTAEGAELVEKKAYRYLSPAYLMGQNRIVAGLDSVGLVNTPNLSKDALNSREKEENVGGEKKEDTTTEENGSLKKELETAQQSLTEANKKLREAKLEAAVKEGRLLPNQKDFAALLTDEQLDKYLETNAVNLKHLEQKTDVNSGGKDIDAKTLDFCSSIGLTKEDVQKYGGEE